MVERLNIPKYIFSVRYISGAPSGPDAQPGVLPLVPGVV